LSFIHTQSMRLASGHEALVTRVLNDDGSTGFGFSLQLDATQARHMALYERGHVAGASANNAGDCASVGTAWEACEPVPWQIEPGFSRLEWLP
jgi:hypothetical protein